MTWRKWNIAAGWCQKSEEKRRKLRKMFEDVTTIEMSLKYVKAFSVTIDDYWTTYTSNISSSIYIWLGERQEYGRTIVQYFWNPTPTQKPNWKVTGDMQNPSGIWDVWNHQINDLARGCSWAFWFHQPIGYLHEFDAPFLEVKWGEALWTGVFNIIILFKFLI